MSRPDPGGPSRRRPPQRPWVMPAIVIAAILVLVGCAIATAVAGVRVF